MRQEGVLWFIARISGEGLLFYWLRKSEEEGDTDLM